MAETASEQSQTNHQPAGTTGTTVVIDIGSHKKKQVKELKKGQGRLMERVQEALAEMKQTGAIQADAQTVVVVVKQKARRRGLLGLN